MLILHAKHAEATPTYLDRDARFSVDATSRAMTPVFHNRGETDLLTWVQSLPLAQIGVGSGLSPVGVIDDRWNLADSCLAGVADDTARESMTVVTTGTYPTSPFLADQLGRALAGREPRPKSARHSRISTGPMARSCPIRPTDRQSCC
ncbi:MAG: hypothetical protein HZT43_17760 [Exiguobacterium profundum]|nr:MAG: hypothetical protein HZT43_17760 [Exiguobacterium profundum]